MLKILQYLIQIRLQKLFRKVDVSIYITVVVFFAIADYLLFPFFEKYSFYVLLCSLEILRYHRNRKDIELLKFRTDYRAILYLEYSIYSVAFTLPLLLLQKWVPFILYQVLIFVFLYIPTIKSHVFKYPFKLFDPFWVIHFRKNKLFLTLIPVVFFVYMGHHYENDSLILFAIFILSIVLCIPSFQREAVYFIKLSNTQNYLGSQFKTQVYNSLFLIIPIAAVIACCGRFELLPYVLLVLFPMFLSVLMKYTLFNKVFEHQILFVLVWGGFQYFIPFIALPVLMYYSKKRIKELKK